MTHPFDTTGDAAILSNPCCCCGQFDLAIAIVNCNGVTDDNFDFFMTDFTTPLVSLTEPLPGTDGDFCTEVSLRNRGHWLTPTDYTGPHPHAANLWCGASTASNILWDDHQDLDDLQDIGDACQVKFALSTTNNNGCQNFGHIYFYRIIKGDPDATPPSLDSLCLIQISNYQPASYDGGDHTFEYYTLTRCDNGDCCKGYYCVTYTDSEGGPHAVCVLAVSEEDVETEYTGLSPTITGPYTKAECPSTCVAVCPCCPDFTPSPLLAVMQVPGVVVANQISLTYDAAHCKWTGSTIQFGNHLNLTVSFTSDCHLHWLMTTDPFFGPSQTYTDTDTGTFDCSVDGSYTAQGGTNKYNGTYSQLVLSLPMPMMMAEPMSSKPASIADPLAMARPTAARKPCGLCGGKRKLK